MTMDPRVIPVGMGEMQFSTSSDSVLVTYSLGSCIGLTVYDPVAHVGGMAHIMLPAGSAVNGDAGKYAATCVPAMIDALIRRGATRARMVVKMAGGAKILGIAVNNGTSIGTQNHEAVIKALDSAGLRVASSDCGGDFGRTMKLFVDSGKVEILTATRGNWTI